MEMNSIALTRKRPSRPTPLLEHIEVGKTGLHAKKLGSISSAYIQKLRFPSRFSGERTNKNTRSKRVERIPGLSRLLAYPPLVYWCNPHLLPPIPDPIPHSVPRHLGGGPVYGGGTHRGWGAENDRGREGKRNEHAEQAAGHRSRKVNQKANRNNPVLYDFVFPCIYWFSVQYSQLYFSHLFISVHVFFLLYL